jgi:hypothetical protein
MASQWKLLIKRKAEHRRSGRRRVIGTYQVFHNGQPVAGLSGMSVESPGPGDNSSTGSRRCIAPGVYGLATHDGERYCTIGYTANVNPAALRRPGLRVTQTGARDGVLLHPGRGFLASVGCLNLTRPLWGGADDMDFIESRNRVIALIDHMRACLAEQFPDENGQEIPTAVIEIT